MDVIELARQVDERAVNGPMGRWASRTRRAMVESTLHLAHYADDLPDDLRGEYLRMLEETIEALPEDIDLDVSRALASTLAALLPESRTTIESKLLVPGAAATNQQQ